MSRKKDWNCIFDYITDCEKIRNKESVKLEGSIFGAPIFDIQSLCNCGSQKSCFVQFE